MSSAKTVFLVGPGFIGWNVLDLLVSENYKVTALVRRDSHATAIEESGATAVKGDLNNKELIEKHASESDIVIHTATADHLPSVAAIISGIKSRAAKGQDTIFIHTSGTSVLDDGAEGGKKSDKIYSDKTREQVDSVPDSAPHREIDLAIVAAQKELSAKAKLAIMIPPLIYGFNPAHKRLTIQIPTMTRFALKHGFAPFVGTGEPVESNIHVKDLARAYIVLLHHMESSSAVELLENPYWFCECTGDKEPSWRQVAEVIAAGLHKAGKIENEKPSKVDEKSYEDLFGEYTSAVIGLNSRSRADRLRELGWEPKEKGWRESFVDDELPEILKEETGEFKGYRGAVAS